MLRAPSSPSNFAQAVAVAAVLHQATAMRTTELLDATIKSAA